MLASGNDRATSGKAMLTIVASRNARKKPSDAIPRTDRDEGTERARRLRRSIAEPLVGSWLSMPAIALFQFAFSADRKRASLPRPLRDRARRSSPGNASFHYQAGCAATCDTRFDEATGATALARPQGRAALAGPALLGLQQARACSDRRPHHRDRGAGGQGSDARGRSGTRVLRDRGGLGEGDDPRSQGGDDGPGRVLRRDGAARCRAAVRHGHHRERDAASGAHLAGVLNVARGPAERCTEGAGRGWRAPAQRRTGAASPLDDWFRFVCARERTAPSRAWAAD